MGKAQEGTSRETRNPADGPASGLLRPRRLVDDRPATLDPEVARLHHRLRVDLIDHLLAVVPDGWDVSAGCCWQPGPAQAALRPDVVVHRTLTRDWQLPDPPVLCVDIAAGPADPRSACRYARLGVDHHWHLDSQRCTLQVSVRLDDAYRHCETLSAESFSSRTASSGSTWVDFGVGIAHLDELLPQFSSRAVG